MSRFESFLELTTLFRRHVWTTNILLTTPLHCHTAQHYSRVQTTLCHRIENSCIHYVWFYSSTNHILIWVNAWTYYFCRKQPLNWEDDTWSFEQLWSGKHLDPTRVAFWFTDTYYTSADSLGHPLKIQIIAGCILVKLRYTVSAWMICFCYILCRSWTNDTCIKLKLWELSSQLVT